MQPIHMIHSGSVKQNNNRHYEILRTKLSDFKGWNTVDVAGIRGADDQIALIMYTDNNKNFKQYNNKQLVESYKAIVDDISLSDKQWDFMHEVESNIAGNLCDSKDLSFIDTTVCFAKNGKTVHNYITFNVVQRVNK